MNKKDSEIPFVAIVGVLLFNLILYKLEETAGKIFFGFIGIFFLLYALYRIAKIFKSDL